jgi:hypothetical protein
VHVKAGKRDLLRQVEVVVSRDKEELANQRRNRDGEQEKREKRMELALNKEVAPEERLEITARDMDDVACEAGSGSAEVRAREAEKGIDITMEMTDTGQCGLHVRVSNSEQTVMVPTQGDKRCPQDCKPLLVPRGSIERLEPLDNPARGWFFSHWSGRCGGQRQCSVHVDRALELTAHFVQLCDGMLCMKGAGEGPWLAGLTDRDGTWAVGSEGRAAIVDEKSGLAPMVAAEERIGLHGIAGASKRPWAVGARGMVLRWDGTTWSKDLAAMMLIPGEEQARTTWHAAWATADGTQGWVVGTAGRVLHLRDGRWRMRSLKEERTLFAVAGGGSPVSVWAVGAGGAIYRWDEDQGFVAQMGAEDDLYAVAVAQDGTLWAAGRKVLWWPRTGSRIEAMPMPNEVDVDELRALLAVSGSEALVAGSKESAESGRPGRLIRVTAMGGKLAFKAKELRERPRALWGAPGNLWIAGDRGTLWQGSAGAW